MSSSSERDRRLARLRLERQRQRELEQTRRRVRKRRVLGTLLALLLVAGLGLVGSRLVGGGGTSTTATATPTSSPLPCRYNRDTTSNPVVSTLPVVGTRTGSAAAMVTDRGTIGIELLTSEAPCATTSFAFLANKSYFDGTTCDRLTTGELAFLQCGDPAKGTGPGYTFPDENLDGATYPAGTVALSNRGPDTNGSRFFLVYADSPLPPTYVPFGRITSGLSLLLAVGKAGADPEGDGAPRRPVAVTSIRVS